MENRRETFYEDYQFFKKNYSHWKLFLKPNGKIDVSKYYDGFLIGFIFFMLIGIMLGFFKINNLLFLISLLLSIISLVMANIIDLIKIRKRFKDNNFPLPPKHIFYTWRSEDLDNERIRLIHKECKNISDTLIEKRISLASCLVEQYSKTPDLSVLKVMEFFGKEFYVITVGILVVMLRVKIDVRNLKVFYEWYLIILLISITIAVLWNLLAKRSLLDNRLVRVKSLNDYILVLKNILLLREVEKSKD